MARGRVAVPRARQGSPARIAAPLGRPAGPRHKIRQWVKQEEHERSLELGREILEREVRRRRLAPPDDARLAGGAATLSVGTGQQLLAALGRGDIHVGQIMRALYPDLPAEDLQSPKPTAFGRVMERSGERRVGKEGRSRWSPYH